MASLRHPRPRQVPVALRVYTLGTFRLEESGCPIALPARAHTRPLALLKVLVALGAEDVPVDPLCAHLWPDADGDHAIDAFNTTLLRLRRCIGYGAVRLAGGRLSLDPACVWLDIREVRRWLAQGREAVRARDPERAAAAARAALDVYQGLFLDGEHGPAPIGLARERLQDELARTIENTAARPADARGPHGAALARRRARGAGPTGGGASRRLGRPRARPGLRSRPLGPAGPAVPSRERPAAAERVATRGRRADHHAISRRPQGRWRLRLLLQLLSRIDSATVSRRRARSCRSPASSG